MANRRRQMPLAERDRQRDVGRRAGVPVFVYADWVLGGVSKYPFALCTPTKTLGAVVGWAVGLFGHHPNAADAFQLSINQIESISRFDSAQLKDDRPPPPPHTQRRKKPKPARPRVFLRASGPKLGSSRFQFWRSMPSRRRRSSLLLPISIKPQRRPKPRPSANIGVDAPVRLSTTPAMLWFDRLHRAAAPHRPPRSLGQTAS